MYSVFIDSTSVYGRDLSFSFLVCTPSLVLGWLSELYREHCRKLLRYVDEISTGGILYFQWLSEDGKGEKFKCTHRMVRMVFTRDKFAFVLMRSGIQLIYQQPSDVVVLF